MVDLVAEHPAADFGLVAVIVGEGQEVFAGEIDPELADVQPAGGFDRQVVPDAQVAQAQVVGILNPEIARGLEVPVQVGIGEARIGVARSFPGPPFESGAPVVGEVVDEAGPVERDRAVEEPALEARFIGRVRFRQE